MEETIKDLPDNLILVGQKPFMNYIRSIELILRKQNKKKVFIKARGMNIKKAVDIVEASKNKFLNDLNISINDVKISTEKFIDSENIERKVSAIEIEIISD